MDLAKFVWYGWGTARDSVTAFALLEGPPRGAIKAHCATDTRGTETGKVSFFRMLFGGLLLPLAALRYELAVRTDPFSSEVVIFQSTAVGPFLRTNLA
jgi:hypothetical protein